MGAEERSRAFSEAQVDAQLVYIEAERDLIAEHQLVVQLESDNSSLQSENAKLRELVRDMHTLLKLSAEIPAKVSHVHLTEQRMRELGIEVEP